MKKFKSMIAVQLILMRYSFKIGSVHGIPIELHITFILLMVAVLVVSIYQLYFFILTVFLFIFVVAHELSHSLVALHYNIKVRKIVLYPIGGASQIDEIPDKPSVEWRMAIAGPLTSFVIGGVLLVLDRIISIEVPVIPTLSTAGRLANDLGTLNIVLGAFNLIPAFPMDGGRVFRALLAERVKFSDATRYAAYLGKILGIAMAVLGAFYSFWLAIVGMFIYIGATEEAESTIVSTAIARVRVRDVMHYEIASVKPETTLIEALETMFKARYRDILIEKDGVFHGIVTWNEIMKVKPEQRSQMLVGDLPMKHIMISPDESILEAYKIMTRERIDLVPVVDTNIQEKVIGVVTSEAVAYAYAKARTSHQ